jgi:glycosyltransferase involved in cell wall biosynthesis
MTASVVIPTHGRSTRLPATIRPLLQDPATTEVVVVADDDPAVATVIAALDDSRIVLVEACVRNQNAARELGVQASSGEVVLFLDDDVIAEPGLVSGHLRCHATPRRVVLGYMPVARGSLRGALEFPSRTYARSYELNVANWQRDAGTILGTMWGGNLSLRRTDALRVGLFNPDFEARFYEDYEFGLRCKAAGLVGVFDRTLRATHLYVRTPRQWLREARTQGAAWAHFGVAAGAGSPPSAVPDFAPRILERLTPAITPVMLALVFACGLLRLRRPERRLAFHLRHLQQRLGARAELERMSAGAPGEACERDMRARSGDHVGPA